LAGKPLTRWQTVPVLIGLAVLPRRGTFSSEFAGRYLTPQDGTIRPSGWLWVPSDNVILRASPTIVPAREQQSDLSRARSSSWTAYRRRRASNAHVFSIAHLTDDHDHRRAIVAHHLYDSHDPLTLWGKQNARNIVSAIVWYADGTKF
jgi:hypothetical protein